MNSQKYGWECPSPRSDQDEAFLPLLWIALPIIDVVVIKSVFPYNLLAILWPVCGAFWVWTKLGRDAHRFGSDRWTEFLVSLKVFNDLMSSFFFWPLDLVLTLINWGHFGSYRRQLEDEILRDCMKEIGPTHGRDSAIFASRFRSAGSIRNTLRTSERTKQLPQEISLSARTTCACGATAVTLATNAAHAVEPAPTNAPISVSSYGWVTAVANMPSEKENTTELRHARVRVIASHPRSGLKLFTEIEAAQFQFKDPDWLKQCFVIAKASDTVTFNVGRMAIAPIWLTPPPFLLETVNYPRMPFSVLAYALEADAKLGPVRVIADVSGRSGLHFDDPDQFREIEGSVRAEYAVSKRCTIAVTGQGSGEFGRYSFDFCVKPASWVDTKAAFYCAHNGLQHQATTTQGTYGYVGIRPVGTFPGLEFHTQADYQETLGKSSGGSLILTGGVRLLMDKGKYSITADYQTVPGIGKMKDSGLLAVRLQARF